MSKAEKIHELYKNEAYAFFAMHKLAVALVAAMISDGVDKHISYIEYDELEDFGVTLKKDGRLPKVTVEWVDESEVQ